MYLVCSVQVDVIDVNEAPYGIDLQGVIAIPENSPERTVVGVLHTLDQETYQTYSYSLLAVNYGYFLLFFKHIDNNSINKTRINNVLVHMYNRFVTHTGFFVPNSIEFA